MSDQVHHHHSHGHDFVQANKDHHNAPGHAHDFSGSPLAQLTAENCARTILKHLQLTSGGMSLLDYACGPGLVSFALREQATQEIEIVGVDLSQKMVDEFNTKLERGHILPSQMRAIQKDVLLNEDTELEGKLFDAAICVQTYHHIPDTAAITLALARRLKKGGKLLVIDMDSESDFGEMIARKTNVKNVVVHKRGFSKDGLAEILVKSGQFSDVQVDVSHSMTTDEMKAVGGVSNWATDLEGPCLTISWIVASGVKI